MKINLECIDTAIRIDVDNIKIDLKALNRLTNAWAEGHAVVVNILIMLHGSPVINIKTINNRTQMQSGDIDITSKWRAIASILVKQHVPDEWLQLINDRCP